MVGEDLEIRRKVAGPDAERVLPDIAHQLKRYVPKQALQAIDLECASEIEKAAAEAVRTEAQDQSRPQRTSRPTTMLDFVAPIVPRWLGWSAPNLSQAEAPEW